MTDVSENVDTVVPDVPPAEERAEARAEAPEPVQSVSVQIPQPEPKKRGRPPGAKNKPKIVELVEAVKEPAKVSFKEPRAEPPPEKVFTQSQVRQLLVETFRMQEQEHRDNKRQRYEQLFRKR
jgi:hypothetical protein